MDSLDFVSVALVAGVDVPTALEERGGQATATRADTFPSEVRDKKYLEALGFKFLGPVEGDSLFQRVEMPEGWTKVAAKHPMWTDLVDPQGRKRGNIFVNRLDKNVIFTGLWRRFNVGYDYNTKCTYAVGKVSKDGKNIYTSSRIRMTDPWDSKAREKAERRARNWIEKQGYPDWHDPTKYWD